MPKETITKQAQKFRARLVRKFKKVTNVGVFACRKVADSTTWSQHAWGNALDIFAENQFTLAAVAKWSTKKWVARFYKVNMVIWQSQVWEWDTKRWNPYHGIPHTNHVHVDFRPHRNGAPPCAF